MVALLPRGVALGAGVSHRVACEQWLYVMGSGELVKVGSTHQPAHRFRTLRRVNRLPDLQCFGLYPIGALTRHGALAHEFAVHAQLRERYGRLRRPEWYRAPVDAVLALVAAYVQGLDVDALVGLS